MRASSVSSRCASRASRFRLRRVSSRRGSLRIDFDKGLNMAVYDLEEQEKIDDLKAWWEQYGKYVSAAVTAVAVVVIGVQGWRWYQRTQAEQASVLYQAVSQAARDKDLSRAKDPATQIVD